MAIPSLNRIRKRTILIAGVTVAALGFLVLKTGYWQIIRGSELSEKAKAQQQGSSVITASRGNIYDRNGKVLAESASVNTLICNPQDVKNSGNAGIIAKELAPVINVESDKILKLLEQSNRYQVIKKRLTTEETDAVRALINSENNEIKKAFNGIYFENDSKRYYPFNIAPHIIGFTGYDNNGLQGIELIYDDELSGKAGSVLSNQTASGTTLDSQQEESIKEPSDGGDVVLTIDETIQHFLEKHLEEAVVEDKLKEGAAGIVMNPKTGEILAMATKPDFDLNNPYDTDIFEKYAIDFTYEGETTPDGDDPDATPKPTEDPDNMSDKKIAAMRNKMWRNKTVSDSYEPGSTFKIITAAAALEEHVVNLDTQFYCPGFRVVEDRKIQCANTDGHGPETFVEGVENSCNPMFIDLGLKLGNEKFMEYFSAFGLTEKTNINLSGEGSSIYYTSEMNNVDLAISSFGQGFQITPIQLITAVSAVINGGQRMKPQIVKEVRNSDGVVKTYEPQVINRVISEDTSAKMREILEGVVSKPDATGKNAYVKGCRIGGKTGTSEKQPRGSDKRIASFIGFAPANDPEVVCLIVLDEPQIDNKYGGTLAAPIAGEVIEDVLNYLGVDKQYISEEEAEKKVEVPDTRDMPVDDAHDTIVAAGLKYKTEGNGDTIVEQLPKPGVMINEGSTIIIYTKDVEQDDLVTVPNLVGMTESTAKETLNNRNLNFEIVGAGHSEAYNSYSVKQSIKAGEKVLPGTVIGVEFRQTATD